MGTLGLNRAVLEYIEHGVAIFEDIRELLENQFNRLTLLEQEVLRWLAVNREPISLEHLNEKFVTVTTKRDILNTINSLMRRSMIIQSNIGFILEPLMIQYVTQYLGEQPIAEIRELRVAAHNNQVLTTC